MADSNPNTKHRLPTDTDDGLLVVMSGPSGVGKTTIARAVDRAIPDALFSVSATTRAQTGADVEGVDYHFVDEPGFRAMIERDEFLEWAEVFGRLYGTPQAWVDEQLRRGRVVICDIDVEGARQIKAKMPEALTLFVLPPSEDELLDRLRSRKREGESAIQKRFAEAKREIAAARASGVYEHFLVNKDLEASIAQAIALVTNARAATRREGNGD
ncbi:MAG: guanylate kinase [Phycisphaera sp.]|nr:MAG: guanylate kinase [Phycisphaera sp.]